MDIRIDKNSRIPIYEQVKDQVKDLIEARQIRTGDQLPTIRELAMALAVNVNTIALAYRDLVNEGVIITERGRGTFVATTPGEHEMQIMRREKLASIVAALVRETDHLGYERGEVEQAFAKHMQEK